jgi:hypothetical protein
MKTKYLSSKFVTLGSLLAAAIMLFGYSQNVSAQWTINGTNINNTNTGNVGIGTSTPNNPLEVSSGSAQYAPAINILASTHPTSRRAVISFGVNSAGTVGWAFGQDRNANGTRDMYLWDASNSRDVMYWSNSGNIGIGSTSPQSNLQIGTQASASSASPASLSLGGTYSSSAGANLKLKLYDDGVTANTYGLGVSAFSMDFVVNPSAGYNWYVGGSSKMSLSNSGNLTVSGNIAAKYQDVAEWVPASGQLPAGTVVVLDSTKSNQVISSTQSYDTRVAGVISEQPGIALGEGGANKVLVATTGRVLVNVDATNGPIHIGDLLVTSDISGAAMKSEPITIGNRKMHMPGTLIGKALEPLEKGSGKILVLLSLQ